LNHLIYILYCLNFKVFYFKKEIVQLIRFNKKNILIILQKFKFISLSNREQQIKGMDMENNLSKEDHWKLLFRTTDLIRDLHSQQYPNFFCGNLTISQIKVAATVCVHYPHSLMLKEIAEELHLTPGAISQLVEALVNADFLVRTRNEQDRRAISIELSKTGLRLYKQSNDFFIKLANKLFTEIPQEKEAVFVEVLQMLHKQLVEMNHKKIEGK